jgi:hypothetical protein
MEKKFDVSPLHELRVSVDASPVRIRVFIKYLLKCFLVIGRKGRMFWY